VFGLQASRKLGEFHIHPQDVDGKLGNLFQLLAGFFLAARSPGRAKNLTPNGYGQSPVTAYSTERGFSTRFEASRISNPTMLPSLS
jgi:hypothetical protein